MSRKPRQIDPALLVPQQADFFEKFSPLEPGFIEPSAEDVAALEEAYQAVMAADPFVQKVQQTLDSLPEEELVPMSNPKFFDLTEMFEIPAGGTHPRKQRAPDNPADHAWRYGEDRALADLESYIRSTYKGHYADGGREDIQAFDAIVAAGHGIGFCVGDVIKYSMRLGKKDGWNRKDVMKMLHYSILLLHAMEKEGK